MTRSRAHEPTTMTGREAMRAAMTEAMRADERVFLMGEDVGRYGGCFAVSMGMLEEFGPERIRDTPLSESAFVGAGIGAALGGCDRSSRPPPPAPTPPPTPRRTGARITPRARRLMAERGLSPDAFGDRDLVTGDLVLAAPTPAARRTESRQESMRRHIAELMEKSWREIPHYHVAQRLDLSTAVERLAITNQARPLADRIVPGALLLCAAARAAAKVPDCNGWWRDGRFERAESVDVGLVLSLRTGGIIVPTIERADELSPAEMMARMTDLVQRARQGRLRASHLAEASITVTSLGDRGADSVSGVIHPPQVALVGFGAVRDEAWPSGDGVVVRPTVHASLAGDHRATDGLGGSRLLAHMQALLDGALPAELDGATPASPEPESLGQEVS